MLAKALNNRYMLAWIISNLLAAGEEWHQWFVPGRVASMNDALVNLVSITAFLAVACWIPPLGSAWRARISARLRAVMPVPIPLPAPKKATR